jgi:hypothetical protein
MRISGLSEDLNIKIFFGDKIPQAPYVDLNLYANIFFQKEHVLLESAARLEVMLAMLGKSNRFLKFSSNHTIFVVALFA